MKYGKWLAFVFVLVLCAAMTACGGSGDISPAGNGDASSQPVSAPSEDAPSEDAPDVEEPEQDVVYAPIPLSDDYTFTDPTDLDFDTRYVYAGYEGCKLLSDMKNFGYEATAMYEILYTKDGEFVGEYQYFVCADETMAGDLTAYFQGQGQKVTQDGKVLYAFNDGDTVLAMAMTYQGMGVVADETPESYLSFTADFNGLTEYGE